MQSPRRAHVRGSRWLVPRFAVAKLGRRRNIRFITWSRLFISMSALVQSISIIRVSGVVLSGIDRLNKCQRLFPRKHRTLYHGKYLRGFFMRILLLSTLREPMRKQITSALFRIWWFDVDMAVELFIDVSLVTVTGCFISNVVSRFRPENKKFIE